MFLFFFFFAFVFVGMTLALYGGYRSIQETREQEEARNRAATYLLAVAHTPRPVTRDEAAEREGLDDSLVAHVEDYLRSEQEQAAKFVHQPSVESLYHRADGSTHVN